MSDGKKEVREKLEHGEGVIRDEGEKLVIEVPKPKDLSLEEIGNKGGDLKAICSGCTDILSAVGHFI